MRRRVALVIHTRLNALLCASWPTPRAGVRPRLPKPGVYFRRVTRGAPPGVGAPPRSALPHVRLLIARERVLYLQFCFEPIIHRPSGLEIPFLSKEISGL